MREFEEKIEKAKDILNRLMKEDIPLKEAVKLYKEGVRELKEAKKMLQEAKLEIEEIKKR